MLLIDHQQHAAAISLSSFSLSPREVAQYSLGHPLLPAKPRPTAWDRTPEGRHCRRYTPWHRGTDCCGNVQQAGKVVAVKAAKSACGSSTNVESSEAHSSSEPVPRIQCAQPIRAFPFPIGHSRSSRSRTTCPPDRDGGPWRQKVVAGR